MKVQHIEPAGKTLHLLQHHRVIRDMLTDIRVEPQGLAARRHQICAGSGVAAGKQGDIVTLPDELVDQVRNHAFGASVKTGRYAFDDGRNLRYLHGYTCVSCGDVTTVMPEVSSGRVEKSNRRHSPSMPSGYRSGRFRVPQGSDGRWIPLAPTIRVFFLLD